jgi:hypothetical protein
MLGNSAPSKKKSVHLNKSSQLPVETSVHLNGQQPVKK